MKKTISALLALCLTLSLALVPASALELEDAKELLRQVYVDGIPDELCEAARIDGLSEYGIWWRIMLPLSKPSLATLTIFTFVNTWNDFLGPYMYLTTDTKKTLQLGLRMFLGQYSSEYGLIMAASVVALIPVLIVFLALQKYFVQGIASSGLKG